MGNHYARLRYVSQSLANSRGNEPIDGICLRMSIAFAKFVESIMGRRQSLTNAASVR
jgi:hypothetical protein